VGHRRWGRWRARSDNHSLDRSGADPRQSSRRCPQGSPWTYHTEPVKPALAVRPGATSGDHRRDRRAAAADGKARIGFCATRYVAPAHGAALGPPLASDVLPLDQTPGRKPVQRSCHGRHRRLASRLDESPPERDLRNLRGGHGPSLLAQDLFRSLGKDHAARLTRARAPVFGELAGLSVRLQVIGAKTLSEGSSEVVGSAP